MHSIKQIHSLNTKHIKITIMYYYYYHKRRKHPSKMFMTNWQCKAAQITKLSFICYFFCSTFLNHVFFFFFSFRFPFSNVVESKINLFMQCANARFPCAQLLITLANIQRYLNYLYFIKVVSNILTHISCTRQLPGVLIGFYWM